ncbi:MAG: hypothetical protein KC910_38750, partial [Candidatus Eremiobacteraeota bacterium]|nr:hypothetical protein [Candidatus Eremiobacteraeota bacterium]
EQANAVAAATEMYQRLAGPFEAASLPGQLRGLTYQMRPAEPYDGPFEPGKAIGYLAHQVGGKIRELEAQATSLSQDISQARTKVEEARGQVSTWDKLNIFSQSEAEKAVAKEADQLSRLEKRQSYLQDMAYLTFERAVTEMTELRAFYYAKELSQQVRALTAKSGSRTSGYGKNKTTYYYCY